MPWLHEVLLLALHTCPGIISFTFEMKLFLRRSPPEMILFIGAWKLAFKIISEALLQRLNIFRHVQRR